MKKVLSLTLVFCIVMSLSACSFEDCFYSFAGTKNGFDIAVRKFPRSAFVASYTCTEYIENMEITIPDECDGIPITQLGGATGSGFPSPFGIYLQSFMNAPEESDYNAIFRGDIDEFEILEDYAIEDVVFNLNIGKNVEIVELVIMDEYYPHINDDGSITFYHAVVNINCSDENKHFYSKDGKLYDKKTDELISDFAYASPK